MSFQSMTTQHYFQSFLEVTSLSLPSCDVVPRIMFYLVRKGEQALLFHTLTSSVASNAAQMSSLEALTKIVLSFWFCALFRESEQL